MKFGAIVVAGSGKIGGHVASKNRAGAYLRTKTTPSNPRTTAQALVRGILSSVSTAWAGLTDAQRAGWNGAVAQWAKTDIFGDIKNPSGFNLFMKINANLLSIEEAILMDVPAKQELGDLLLSAATVAVGAATVTFTFLGTAAAGTTVQVSATPPMSAGISNAKKRFRNISFYSGAPVAADIYTAYVAKFGAPAAGDNIQFAVELIGDNGQKGVKSSVKATVTA